MGSSYSPMQRGVLRLSSGLAATCDYEFSSSEGGRLELPSALYLPLRERDTGTLVLANGESRAVEVSFGPQVGEATFSAGDRA